MDLLFCLKYDCTGGGRLNRKFEDFIEYPMEGQDLQQFRKGSSDAKDFVVSFYAKANGTLTYGVGFYDASNNNTTVSELFIHIKLAKIYNKQLVQIHDGAFGNKIMV